MRLAVLLFCLPLVASCIDTLFYYPEEWSGHYKKPHNETSMERTVRREITHWTNDPSKKKRVGFLYTYETKLRGSRGSRECYYIYDRNGLKAVGFITAEGTFYRFNSQGRFEEPAVGSYPIFDLGLKVFFGFPLDDHIGIEAIDPYR